jgi:hypothetical protein
MELNDVALWTAWALAGIFIAAVSQACHGSKAGK